MALGSSSQVLGIVARCEFRRMLIEWGACPNGNASGKVLVGIYWLGRDTAGHIWIEDNIAEFRYRIKYIGNWCWRIIGSEL